MEQTRRQFLHRLGFSAAGAGLISWRPVGSRADELPLPGLPRGTPEEEGVASVAILNFIAALERAKIELHSLMLVRHGRVIAEGWWAPYAASFNHGLYSLSKSVTSTAVGLAVADGKFTVDDEAVDFFPDALPEAVGENLAAMRVRDLLCMASGHATDPTWEMVKTRDWVRTVLASPVLHAPGSRFVYNSGATYLLSAIVQKVTGKTLLDFLTPRLFEPLGIQGATWESCPKGVNTGGWGLSLPTDALAKFGQLYLQQGSWRGKELIPARWVNEAASVKIQQPLPEKPSRPHSANDWLQGYGYQFWRCQHRAYRGDGAFGQFCVVLPEQDAVVVLTGETNEMQQELDRIWEILLPALGPKALPENAAEHGRLKQKLASLALPALVSGPEPALAEAISGKSFRMETNSLGIASASFAFRNDGATVVFREGQQEHSIRCGNGAWSRGETALPGTPPRLVSGGAPPAGTRHKVAACGAWKDANTYEMIWRYCETPHHDAVTCRFEADIVGISFTNSMARLNGKKDESRPALSGKISP